MFLGLQFILYNFSLLNLSEIIYLDSNNFISIFNKRIFRY